MDLLGVHAGFSSKDLQKAWHAAIKRAHPDIDKTPGATARAQAINAAYEYLKR
jgi:DnaJ-class molecular chaperone